MAQLPSRKTVGRCMVVGLTTYAFANSYTHGVHWVQKWSPDDAVELFAYGTAALPEALILYLAAIRRKADAKALVIGGLSALWTFWVNGASAVSSGSGFVVALAPPVAALLLLWLELEPEEVQDETTAQSPAQLEPEPIVAQDEITAQSPAQLEPEPIVAQLEPEPIVAQPEPELSPTPELEPEPIVAQPELPVAPAHTVIEPSVAQNVTRLSPRPVAQKPKAQRGAFAEGVKWLTAQVAEGNWTKERKAQDLANELGVSIATAKRIRTEVFGPVRAQKEAKTDETDQKESA